MLYLRYNDRVTLRGDKDTGLNFKLDVGLYRLNQQVACQRYRQTFLDANSKISAAVAYVRNVKNTLVAAIAPRTQAFGIA